MPELPEVETVARQLAPLVTGAVIARVRVLDKKLVETDTGSIARKRLAGRHIVNVRRTGKQIVLALSGLGKSGRPLWLAVHLRMTGRLIYLAPSSKVDKRHLRAWIELNTGRLLFYDTRRFGTVRVVESEAELEPAGLDPLDACFTGELLERMVNGSSQPVKSWLLRQDKLAGIGNIYACEALFAAGIDPRRQAGSLSRTEVQSLHRSLRRILRDAIRHCGTTFADFQDTRGSTGGYQRFLKVYGRSGGACPKCKAEIARIVQQQRSTFYCSRCQK